MEEIYSFLKDNKAQIQSRASEGDKVCQEIITVYRMHCKVPQDPGAAGVLMGLVDDYKLARQRKET